MRNGYKIFDSDTHIAPMAETLEPYFDASIRHSVADWEQFKVPFRIGWAGEILATSLPAPLSVQKKTRMARRAADFRRSRTQGAYRISLPKIHGKQVSDAGWVR